jgi:hypothetical protein
VVFDPEELICLANEMMAQAKVQLLFRTQGRKKGADDDATTESSRKELHGN